MTDEAELYEPMSVQAVAQELGCSESTLYNKIQAEQIPFTRINKKTVVIMRKDLPKIKACVEKRSNSAASVAHKLDVNMDHIFKELHRLTALVEEANSRMSRLETKFHLVHSDKLTYDGTGKAPTVGDMVRKSLVKGQ